MNELSQISNLQDIDRHRVVLLKQLHKQEKQVKQDYERIASGWRRWTNIGSTVSNIAMSILPNLNLFSYGWSLINRVFKRKKK